MTRFNNLIAVGLGGFLGAIARYGIGSVFLCREGFFWGTFFVNITGSFLLGFVQVLALKRLALGPRFRLFAGVGFCGAYTTFSTFTKESLELLYHHQLAASIFYMAGTTACCLFAAFSGMAFGYFFINLLEKRKSRLINSDRE